MMLAKSRLVSVLGNDRVRLPAEETRPASQADLLDAAKAIHDQTKEEMEVRFKDLEPGVAIRVAKAMEGIVKERFAELDNTVKKDLTYHGEILTKQMESQLTVLQQAFQVQMAAFAATIDEKIEGLERTYQMGLEQIRTMLETWKPEVRVENIVSPTPINVDNHVEPTPVQVTNQVSPTPVNVENIVNSAPAQVQNVIQPAQVQLTLNPAPPREKYIEYDTYGRPVTIKESDIVLPTEEIADAS